MNSYLGQPVGASLAEAAANVSILFTGDFYPTGRISELIELEKYDAIFNEFVALARGSDVAVTNLEAAITRASKPILKTGPNLKASLRTAEALRYCGFNVVTLANNHIMDFGAVGLRETFEVCREHGLDWVGAGLDPDAVERPLVVTASGVRIGFVNFAENEFSTFEEDGAKANPLDPIKNFYSISRLKRETDLVFVIVHGGHEGYRYPSPRMQKTYRFFVDAGANAVICHHSHCYSGYELYNGAPIFYGLGNFLFDSPVNRSDDWCSGFAVKFSLERGNLEFQLLPYVQNNDCPGIRLVSGDEIDSFRRNLGQINDVIADLDRLSLEFELLCEARRVAYEGCLEPYSSSTMHAARRRGYLPAWFGKKKRMRLLNIVRCEAHRDILLGILRRSAL